MPSFQLQSFSKINLSLDVMGYDDRAQKHFLNTVFYRLEEPSDTLILDEIGGKGNELICYTPGVPTTGLNTIHKALDLLGVKGWRVTLKKHIPLQAGLGGGSGNAAAVLQFFGERKRIPEHELQKLAAQIGADVPFFLLEDNLAYFEGFGDQYLQSWRIEPLPIELLTTGVAVSTAEAYARLDRKQCGRQSVKTEALIKLLNEGKDLTAELLRPYAHNDFEESFFEAAPSWKGKGHLCGSGGMLWNFIAEHTPPCANEHRGVSNATYTDLW